MNLKPTCWTSSPSAWFAQAEAQFVLRRITQDDTKYNTWFQHCTLLLKMKVYSENATRALSQRLWLYPSSLHLQKQICLRRSKLLAPNDTAYKRWSCHSGLKLLCKLCRTSPPPAMGPDLPFFGHAGHADPLNGWRCCSQKQVMSRSIQVRQR